MLKIFRRWSNLQSVYNWAAINLSYPCCHLRLSRFSRVSATWHTVIEKTTFSSATCFDRVANVRSSVFIVSANPLWRFKRSKQLCLQNSTVMPSALAEAVSQARLLRFLSVHGEVYRVSGSSTFGLCVIVRNASARKQFYSILDAPQRCFLCTVVQKHWEYPSTGNI